MAAREVLARVIPRSLGKLLPRLMNEFSPIGLKRGNSHG